MTERFIAYCARKEAAARAASIPGFTTTADSSPPDVVRLGNAWTRRLFEGDFYRSASPSLPDVPIANLVFVQSADGNTVAPDPSTLGGGETDLHLVYEGLSRIDADGILAGAGTARSRDIVFSLWHPELVALRLFRGRPRHPAQIVMTNSGNLRFDDGLMFLEPHLSVFVITNSAAAPRVRARVNGRPWIEVIDAGDPLSPLHAMRALRARGLSVVSCVGGRQTATALLGQHLVKDIYLTTSPIAAGQPETPYCEVPPVGARPVLVKAGTGIERGVRFEHLVVGD